MCLYGVGPGSDVDPHPAISAKSVGWYYPQTLLLKIGYIKGEKPTDALPTSESFGL
jgi:hypothetical protein